MDLRYVHFVNYLQYWMCPFAVEEQEEEKEEEGQEEPL